MRPTGARPALAEVEGATPVAPAAERLPLAVDLDGTLLLTDTLFEAIAEHMRRRPWWTLLQLAKLPFSVAKVKARLQRAVKLDIAHLPANEAVLTYCLKAKAEGRQVWLVSAADQLTVERVARRFALFDRVIGSDGETNNKGASKARWLEQAAPNGFEYVGDSPADLKVWRSAAAASVVGGGKRRQQAIKASGVRIARTFERPRAGLGVWLKAMRLHQWAKNALIFVPPILAMKITDLSAMATCAIALPLIGLMASGTYIINDLLDLRADRNHHSKRFRPFASGQIKLWQGFVAAPLMILTGVAGGAAISPAFAETMLSYLLITLCYSLAVKRVALVDTLTLSFLYTLRLIMGAVLTGVPLTQWLFVFSMFLFLSLSLAKRHVEVKRKAAQGERRLANRGYMAEDAILTLGLGLATATVTPLILVLYILFSVWPSGVYPTPEALWVAPVVLSMWLMRIWLLANRGELHDDPVVFAVKDKQSLALGFALAVGFATAVLVPAGGLDLMRFK